MLLQELRNFFLNNMLWTVETIIRSGSAKPTAFVLIRLFQDLKSSGFDLENSKINKHNRFKRLLFLCCLAYNLMLLLGNWIDKKLYT